MKEKAIKDKVKRWLQEDEVDLFLGYKMVEGHPLPHSFTKHHLEEIEELTCGPSRYPLEKIAAKIAVERPALRIGMLARDCTRRALNVLGIWNQLEPDRIMTIDVNCCPSSLKDRMDCSYLEPRKGGGHEKKVGIHTGMAIEEIEAFGGTERFARWTYEFQKCIKCYGCRDICPVCFCKECSLEHPDLIGTGSLPPEVPIFHLVRAIHMAGRCVDCGLCEDACPVDIPLRLLYRKVNEIVRTLFDYETGTSSELPPLSVLGEKVVLEPRPLTAA